jgi:membrane fusion protein (multidrug efflux system)
MSLLEQPVRPAAERQAPVQRAAEQRQVDRPTTPGVATPRRRRLLQVGVIVAVTAALGIGGGSWWLEARHWESTDDASIDVHMVRVSPQVGGRVARVLADDNQQVQAGQLLLEIDPADFKVRLDQALANKAGAAGKLAQAHAQLKVARANLDELEAEVGVAQANATNASIDVKRYEELARIHSAALSQQQLDNAIANAKSTAANLTAAQRKVGAAQAQIALAESQVQTAEADMQAAAAQVEQAQLDLSYTKLVAPEAGHIAHKNVANGDYVQVGQNLMALVPNQVWVTANFKETQLDHMRPGQPVEIDVDAYPDRTFHGHIDSVQAGSGTAFALLPPENATGNYVKVVQRVPVKIVFDDPSGAKRLLGPGMSVVPYVRIR